MGILIASQILVWIAIVVLAVLMIALARQVGVLHERIAPVGALKMDRGIAVGQKAPAMDMVTLDGATLRMGEPLKDHLAQLLLFVSPDCPICKNILPIAKRFARAEAISIVLVGDGELAEQRKMIERLELQSLPFVNNPEIGMRFGVGKLPYAVLIDAQGVVASAGLVNSREHLESLITAKEMQIPSVQAYLRKNVV